MRVKEIMTKSPVYCSGDTNLAAAAEIMWNRNCGFLPVVGPEQKVIGVITDRDMTIAMATRNRLPGEIPVREVCSGVAYSCRADDDIRTALAAMAAKKVRRLPVVDAAGKLTGILSSDDIVLRSDSRADGALSPQEIIRDLREVYRSQIDQAQKRAANA
jgi:CBS domain-containing protein